MFLSYKLFAHVGAYARGCLVLLLYGSLLSHHMASEAWIVMMTNRTFTLENWHPWWSKFCACLNKSDMILTRAYPHTQLTSHVIYGQGCRFQSWLSKLRLGNQPTRSYNDHQLFHDCRMRKWSRPSAHTLTRRSKSCNGMMKTNSLMF